MPRSKHWILATIGLLVTVGVGSTTLGGCSACPSSFGANNANTSAAREVHASIRNVAVIDPEDEPHATFAPLTGPGAPSPPPSCNPSN
jgi:hypothetical protein